MMSNASPNTTGLVLIRRELQRLPILKQISILFLYRFVSGVAYNRPAPPARRIDLMVPA